VKIGRNQRCPCGSGKRFKHCHGSFKQEAQPANHQFVAQAQRRHQADEKIREAQQGFGRPLISAKVAGHQVVAVGKKVFWSKTWKTVPDFLSDYLKTILGPQWGNDEIEKPLANRHPIMQWYDAYCRYQAKVIKNPGEVTNSEVTGVVSCYLGLAYSLYLIAHNVELQARMVRRLLDPTQFQGAYYELIVANTLIRAGFMLTLEDETDGASKHCEFAAISKTTGKRYWVEAKMRAVAGVLGRTERDGGNDLNPLSRLNKHITEALRKPATDERLIFTDLNTDYDPKTGDKPGWVKPATATLQRYERNHSDVKAYVIVTNTPFHRMLNEPAPIIAMPYGLGMPDFNRPGYYRFSQAYMNKRKHLDAFHICDAFEKYLAFPTTFDGTLPSEAFGRAPKRIKIGETYQFTDASNIIGTVTSATVNEANKMVHVAVTTKDGKCYILREVMTDDAFADYKAHRESYFGEILPVSRKVNNQYELFEFFIDAYRSLTRAQLMAHMAPYFKPGDLDKHTDEELLAIYCEGLVAMTPKPENEG
jgi:SEC-C motif